MVADTLLNRVLWIRMQLLRWTHWRPFVKATQRPRHTQTQLLLRLLRRNRDTRFGREHGFDAITSYADFAAAVPVHTYETLRPYLEEQERTGRSSLTAERAIMYARTSGTTGQAKLIPVLRETMRGNKRSQAIQSFVQFSAEPAAYYGRFLAIVSPAVEGATDSGIPYGSTSGFMYKNMPAVAKTKHVLPYQVFGIANYDLKYRLILRLAVMEKDITHIACANPSTLVKLLAVLDTDRAALLRDIAAGRFTGMDALPADVRDVVTPRLSCSMRRLAELQTILGAPHPTFAQLWPKLRLVSTWTGGSCQIPLATIRSALPAHTRVADLGYLASELRGTLVTDLRQHAGTPTIHENFFEFVDRDDWDADQPVFRTIEQLEQGREYYVFPTTSGGLYRYFMNDIVRVTGWFHATPTIEFVQKGKGVTNITGEKVYESQVIEAVQSTLRQDGAQPASAFFMVLADAERSVYRLVIEAAAPTEGWRRQMSGTVDSRLAQLNLEYAAKRASGRLAPLELLAVTPGTGEAYKRRCVEQGQREGQFKLVALQYQTDCAFPFADFRAALVPEAST